MQYIRAKHFREFKEFKVEAIYKPYRSGGVKMGDKFIGKTFKEVDGKFKEEKWFQNDDGSWRTELQDPSEKIDRDFFKTYKKVFDVKISTPKEITIKTDKGDVTDTEFNINGLGSYKIKCMLEADLDLEVPMDGDNPKFDWEDEMFMEAVGNSFKMKVTGKSMDTKYNVILKEKGSKSEPTDQAQPGFKEGAVVDNSAEDALPF